MQAVGGERAQEGTGEGEGDNVVTGDLAMLIFEFGIFHPLFLCRSTGI